MNALTSLPTMVSPSILHLRSSAGLYGADRMVLTLNHALARADISSRLLSINNYLMREQPLHDAARKLGHDAELLPCRGRFDPRTMSTLAATIAAHDSPVLHAHDYKSAFYAWLASRRRRTPLVATLHGRVETSRSLRLYNQVELALLRRFDALVVVAHAQIDSLLQAGIEPARIHQVDNAIPSPPAVGDVSPSLRNEFGLDRAKYVFGAVARLSPEKNLSMLLAAFAALAAGRPGVALAIAGDGPERTALEAQANELGLGACVHFLGARSDMERIYPLIDCLVLPSLSEGMPLVVLEAMARTLPVIASAVGDVPRLLSHSAHGRMVPPGNPEALYQALMAAASEPGRRDQCARNYVLHHHSPAVMAERYLDVYRSLPVHGHGRKIS